MTESAVSSPNRRAFEAIMNCSEQLCSTRSRVNADGVHCQKADGGCQKKNDIVTDVCNRCFIGGISEFERDKRGVEVMREKNRGVVTGRVRSVLSRSGQALCWPSVSEVPLQALKSAVALVLCICAGDSEQLARDKGGGFFPV